MYLSVSKKHGYTPSSVFLEDGTRANWIGDPKAEKIILNLHGTSSISLHTPSKVDNDLRK